MSEKINQRAVKSGRRQSKTLMNKKQFLSLSFLLSLILVLSPAQLFAFEFDNAQADRPVEISTTLDVLSLDPSTNALTTIEASGVWPNGCVPELGSVEFGPLGAGSGFVHITAIAEPDGFACNQAETEWRFPVDLQFDEPGYYFVQLSIVSEQLGTKESYAWKDLSVRGHVTLTPRSPQPDEATTLTVTGVHHDACVPELVSNNVIDGVITVELMTPDPFRSVCGQAVTLWSIDAEIDTLPDGVYGVEVYTSEQYEGVTLERKLYTTDTFSVGVNASNVINHFVYIPGFVLESTSVSSQ